MSRRCRVLVLTFLLAFVGGCSTPSGTEQIEGRTMGTTYQVTTAAGVLQLPAAQVSIDSLLEAINMSMSTYIDASIISRINASTDTSTLFPVDTHFIEVFERAITVYEATDGAFNPAVAPLIDAWGFGNAQPQDLSPVQVDSLRDLVDFSAFVLLPDGMLRKTRPQVQLNFSAIAKGYGVDAVGIWLEKHGVTSYFVEIGGEVRTRGNHPEGRSWRVGIDRPEPAPIEQRTLQAVIPLDNVSMATSGNYRNYYERDGRKYVHTINPHTGYPEISPLLSVSVIASDCMTADAFATAFMVMGIDKAWRLAESNASLEAYFILSDSSGAYLERFTTGFPERLKM